MNRLIFALTLAALPSAAAAMDVTTFLAKATALEKKGPLALFSSDIGVLKGEIVNSAKALRLERAAAEKTGRRPATCIPASVSFNNTEVLSHFRAIPAARRGMSVKDGFAELVKKKYPCPA